MIQLNQRLIRLMLVSKLNNLCNKMISVVKLWVLNKFVIPTQVKNFLGIHMLMIKLLATI